MQALSKVPRGIRAAALVAAGIAISFLGRKLLDNIAIALPEWALVIDKFGGLIIGMVVVLGALIPLFRLYGYFDRSSDEKSEDG